MKTISELWNIAAVRHAVISIVIILITVVFWLIYRSIKKSYLKKKNIDERTRAASSVRSVIYDTIKVSIFFLLVLTILQINGVNVTSLIAGVGVASAVIGLALQDFLKDIIMGVHIMMDDFYQIGDVVKYEDEEGTIEAFNLRTTKIRSIGSGDLITICNRNVSKVSKSSPDVYIHLPLPYDLKIGDANALLEKVVESIKECEGIAASTFLGTNNFDDSSVDHLIKVVCEKPDMKLGCRRRALAAIRQTLEAEHVDIPYQHVDVHMK